MLMRSPEFHAELRDALNFAFAQFALIPKDQMTPQLKETQDALFTLKVILDSIQETTQLGLASAIPPILIHLIPTSRLLFEQRVTRQAAARLAEVTQAESQQRQSG